ncbi:MAG: hypothetical protein KGS61_13520 [Verrucomicrobia bacterium]|nr:hypothetical protein [Verrucomicrobiota bacterium]
MTFSSRFSTWDSAHYLSLSQFGYQRGSASCALYPLWPGAIHVASAAAGGRPVLAGLVLANVLSVIGLWLFYRLVERRWGATVSRDALILMLAFPGALFFSFPYSESLYLVILMLFFWGLESERWAWTAVGGALLPLARPLGVLVVLALGWYWLERPRRLRTRHAKAVLVSDGAAQGLTGFDGLKSGRLRCLGRWLLLLCPLAGYGVYFGLMTAWTGNPIEGFIAQRGYPNSPSIRNMFDLPRFADALLNVDSLGGMMGGALDRVFFLLFVALLPLIWRLDRVWFFYTLPAGLVPALTSWFMSYRRYFMVLFPAFIVLAQLLGKTKSRWLFWYYVALLAAVQAWAVSQFINFKWAG